MDIKFRSLSEAERLIDDINQEIKDIENLLNQQILEVSASCDFKVLADTFVITLDGDTKSKSVSKLDLDAGKVKIPGGIRNLAKQYHLLEELLDKEESLTNAETAISLTFDKQSAGKLLTQINVLKKKVDKQKNDIMAFLNDLATSSVPNSFNKYVFAVAESIVGHVNLTDDQYDVYYYLSTVDSALLYSAYIELRDVENADGDTIKAMYSGIHWCVGSDTVDAGIRLSLTYKWEAPLALYEESRINVGSVSECISAMDKMLEAEDFALDVGTDPLENRLSKGIKLNHINLDALNLKNKIKSMEVEPDKITVNLRKTNNLDDVQAQVYLGIQKFFNKQTKLRMAVSPNGLTLTFTVTNYSKGKSFTNQEVEYFKSWGLTTQQIRKIETILG